MVKARHGRAARRHVGKKWVFNASHFISTIWSSELPSIVSKSTSAWVNIKASSDEITSANILYKHGFPPILFRILSIRTTCIRYIVICNIKHSMIWEDRGTNSSERNRERMDMASESSFPDSPSRLEDIRTFLCIRFFFVTLLNPVPEFPVLSPVGDAKWVRRAHRPLHSIQFSTFFYLQRTISTYFSSYTYF